MSIISVYRKLQNIHVTFKMASSPSACSLLHGRGYKQLNKSKQPKSSVRGTWGAPGVGDRGGQYWRHSVPSSLASLPFLLPTFFFLNSPLIASPDQ